MTESGAQPDIIDLDRLSLENEQTWLYQPENQSSNGAKIDVELCLSKYKNIDPAIAERNCKRQGIFEYLDGLASGSQRQVFDSRTYTRPKKKFTKPEFQLMNDFNLSGTKTITKSSSQKNSIDNLFNVHSNIRNVDRLNETFQMPSANPSEDIENSNYISDDGFSNSYIVSKPININLSEPANNFHNMFDSKFIGYSNNQNDSFTNISPPSLVSSIAMDESGTFNSFSRQGSVSTKRGQGLEINKSNKEDNITQNSICSSMTTSILDEKEMNTSFLSQGPDYEGQIDSFSPSMVNSMDFNFMNSSMNSSNNLQLRKSMESSLINSAIFNNMADSMEDNYSNGKTKFHLRKSFLHVEPGDQEAINEYLKRNSRCNTDDLQDLASDLLLASQKHDNINNTFRIEDTDNSPDDSFLLGEGMSESFIKNTRRESLNTSYNKKTSPLIKSIQKDTKNDTDNTVLPNQILSQQSGNQSNMLTYRKADRTLNDTPKQTPKRNATFRKSSPPSHNWNLSDIDVDAMKDEKYEDIDSNKQDYIAADSNNHIQSPLNRSYHKSTEEKQVLEGKTMAGSSSSSLEGSSSSERTPPQPTTVPLCMDDLEYLAYQQHQSLFQDISTPMPTSNKSKKNIFQTNDFSPIKSVSRDTLSSSTSSNKSNSPLDSQKYGTYKVNSCSTGNLNRMMMGSNEGNRSYSKLASVKRESSAPEFVAQDQNYPSSKLIGRCPQKLARKENGSNSGSILARSVGNSPSRTLYNSKLQNPSLNNNHVLNRYKQNSGSTTELRPMRSGLPASKLRQYSSHKELNRLPGPPRWSVANGLHPSSRTGFHSSNPLLHPAPLTRQGSYTISVQDSSIGSVGNNKKIIPQREVIERNLNIPTKVTNMQINTGQALRAKHNIPTYSAGGTRDIAFNNPRNDTHSNMKVPSSQQTIPTNSQTSLRPVNPIGPSGVANPAQRVPRPSGLPRPSSGIPRKPTLRPPSTYSLAPRPNDQTDCY